MSPFSMQLLKPGDMHDKCILSKVAKVLQINKEIPLDCSFMINVVALKCPVAVGKMKNSQKALKVLGYSKDCKWL